MTVTLEIIGANSSGCIHRASSPRGEALPGATFCASVSISVSEHIQVVQPPGWPTPKGFANGVIATGRTLYVAGQIGSNADGTLASDTLPGQFAQALDNVLAVVRAAGGSERDLVKMTVYVTDVAAYREAV